MSALVLERVVNAQYPEVAPLRRAANDVLYATATDEFRSTLMLVVSELCTNAIEALDNPLASFTLRVKEYDDRVEIEVEDSGPGFAEAFGKKGSDDGNPRGRGLQVVQSLVDEFSVKRRRGKTTVCCVLRRPPE